MLILHLFQLIYKGTIAEKEKYSHESGQIKPKGYFTFC